MTEHRKRDLSNTYRKTREQLTEILYQEDPSEMGLSIGAPLDEYSSEAEILMVALKQATNRAEVRLVLEDHFPSVGDSLVDRVFECWEDFLGKSAVQ